MNLETGVQLMNRRLEEELYLIEGMIWERDYVILLGDPKVGKSLCSMQMACAMTCGEPFLNTYEVPEPMNVLYVQTEGKLQDTIERLKAMTGAEGVPWDPSRFHHIFAQSIALDDPMEVSALLHKVRDVHPRVVFFDPLYMCMKGDLKDNKDTRRVVSGLRRISDVLGAAIVLNHHQHRPRRDTQGKLIDEGGDEGIFGSFVWRAFVDHVLSIRSRHDKIRLLTCHTQRTSRVIDNVELRLNQPYPLYYEIVGEDQKPYIEEIFLYMTEHVNLCNGISAKDLHHQTKKSPSAVKKSLSILAREGKVKVLNPGHRPCLYTIIEK